MKLNIANVHVGDHASENFKIEDEAKTEKITRP